MKNWFYSLDNKIISTFRKWGISTLRISLGIVFLWFGLLKIFDVSPVVNLISSTYTFFPIGTFVMLLGFWEVVIGLGLIFKKVLRFTLAILWIQMFGTVVTPLLDPYIFFSGGNPLLLTMEGEFVVKNIILITAGIVIAGYEVEPVKIISTQNSK